MIIETDKFEHLDCDQYEKAVGNKTVYNCTKCSKTFVQLKSFHDHECHKKTEKVPCPLCEKVISRSNISKHTKLHAITGILCDICEKSFKDNSAFENHQHKQVPKRDCNICNKIFTRPSLLRNHSVRFHGSGNVKKERLSIISCKFCGLECPSTSAVRKHMELEHMDKAIHCGFCDNRFFSKRGLKQHKQDHAIAWRR